MENQENFSLIMDMFKQINNSISSLSQNQVLICEKIKLLDEKMDTKFATMDAKIDKLRQDMDINFNSVRKDISNLKCDIDIVYDLEIKSSKQLKQLM